MPYMFKRTSASLILLGILAVIAGIVAIAWPGVTGYALVLVFTGGQQSQFAQRPSTLRTVA
jgi:uncharacterized membrane protein HdeD (DUF308 family)